MISRDKQICQNTLGHCCRDASRLHCTSDYHLPGLAHQDVHVTNVAVDRTTERTILYDNSSVAKMGDCAEMCDYCLYETIGTMLDSPPTTSGRFSPTEPDVYKMDRLLDFDVFFPNHTEEFATGRIAALQTGLAAGGSFESWMDGDE